jgi:hypothetical protein
MGFSGVGVAPPKLISKKLPPFSAGTFALLIYNLINRMKKAYPQHYIEPVVNLLKILSISGQPNVLGSGSDRTVLYSADIDVQDTVNWSPQLPAQFRKVVETIDTTKDVKITDIKCGWVPEWNLLESAHLTKGVVLNYNYEILMARLESLYDRKIITKEEYDESRPLLKPHPNPLEFLIAKRALRFGIVRWTAKDIMAGYVKLRDGTTLKLESALQHRTITKIDVIVWIENRFVDCEVVYQIIRQGRPLVSVTPEEVTQGIKESLLVFAAESNWMKVAKRMYSLARISKATYIQEKLRINIFNSDLGRLYSVLSDALSLEALRESGTTVKEKVRIKQETDGFRARIALITLPPLLKPIDPFTPKFIDILQSILQPRVKAALKDLRLLPLPAKWLP